MKKNIIILMMLTIVSMIIGFSKDLVLAFFFGASYITDAYIISLTIPQTIFGFVGSAISTTFIPLYTSIGEENGIDNANKFTNNLMNVLLIISTFIVALVFQFTEQTVLIFASGFEDKTLQLAVNFTRISIFSIYFSGIIFLFTSYLQSKNRFISTGLMTVPLNIVTIVSIFIGAKYNLNYLALGGIAATFFQLLLILIDIKKSDYSYKLYFNIKDKNIKKMLMLSIPAILGSSIYQINVLVDRTLASSISEGGISVLSYSNKITALIFAVLVVPIATVIYPNLSKMYANAKNQEFKSIIRESLSAINVLIIPSIVGILFFSNNIVSLLYGRGQFDANAISMTAGALTFYTIGIIGVSTREIFYRSFYAMQDTKTPLINASVSLLINILLNIILSKYMGLNGLALATSLSAILCSLLLIISLRKKIGPLGMKQISISFLKILFASLVMGLLAKLSFNYLTTSLSQNLSLIIAIGVGAVSYFVIIYFMKIEDVDVIVGAIKKKLGRGAA